MLVITIKPERISELLAETLVVGETGLTLLVVHKELNYLRMCVLSKYTTRSVSISYFSITLAPLAARYWSGTPGGKVLMTPNISLL